MADGVPACLLDPDDIEYSDLPCHGYLTDICECTFSDIFFETAYLATIFGTPTAPLRRPSLVCTSRCPRLGGR
jgi:hypothetical protein